MEAQNLKRREEAERVAERVHGLSVVIIRQAGESGGLYGSVSARDIADATTAAGLTVTRQQVVLEQPIKTAGPVAGPRGAAPGGEHPGHRQRRPQPEEAERQARGEAVGAAAEAEDKSKRKCWTRKPCSQSDSGAEPPAA